MNMNVHCWGCELLCARRGLLWLLCRVSHVYDDLLTMMIFVCVCARRGACTTMSTFTHCMLPLSCTLICPCTYPHIGVAPVLLIHDEQHEYTYMLCVSLIFIHHMRRGVTRHCNGCLCWCCFCVICHVSCVILFAYCCWLSDVHA